MTTAVVRLFELAPAGVMRDEQPNDIGRVGRGRAAALRSRFPCPLHSFRMVGFPQYGVDRSGSACVQNCDSPFHFRTDGHYDENIARVSPSKFVVNTWSEIK